MSFKIDLAHIRNTIFRLLPPEAQVTRLEFEGPEIAIYVRNPKFLLEHTGILSQLAKTIKKRVVIRTDPSIRKDPNEARKIIESIVPKEAGIERVEFDAVLGEVVIEARNPKKVAEKVNQILVETGWRPRIVRAPPMRSRTYEEIVSMFYKREAMEYRLNFLRELGEAIHRDVLLARDGNNYVRITFLGAAQEVGRSAILVETAESRILLDFGINPGRGLSPNAFPRLDLVGIEPEDIDAVVVSHAHLDHCGLVPYLFKYGYRGPVYTTQATRDLMILLLKDFIEILEKSGQEPLFTMKDVEVMLLHTIPLRYNVVTDIAPDVRLTLYNAGHILGSAIIHLHIGNGFYNIVYTGDFKFGKTRLLERADYVFPRVDALIMETTYGATNQPRREEAERMLIEIIKRTVERGGKVLIPVLSVGRAQEILLVLREALENKQLPEIPIYIEGLVEEVTAIHTAYPELLAKPLRAMLEEGINPFKHEQFQRVDRNKPRIDIVEERQPCVIVATSGMLTGGPSVEYFKLLAPDPKNSIVFVSYQIEGTLGRKVKDGAKEVTFVGEHGKIETIKINMEVYAIEGFSGHSDRQQLYDYLRSITPKPNKVFLVHGEPNAISAFKNAISGRNAKKLGFRSLEVYAPRILESYTPAYNL